MIKGKGLRAILFAAVVGMMVPGTAQAQDDRFDSGWLESLRQEAEDQGISTPTIERFLRNITPLEIVAQSRKNQPEFTRAITLSQYLALRVNPRSISRGADTIRDNRDTLDEMKERFGVGPDILMAIYSMETNYGDNTGDVAVVQTLVTLARDNPDFRREVFAALKLYDEGYTEIETRPGSRAGAFGQTQFMPSTFHRLGVDGDGDGRIDIWNSLSDVFASTANHLSKSGWHSGEHWGRAVSAPANFDCALLTDRKADLKTPGMTKSLREWSAIGVGLPGGMALPQDHDGRVALIAPDFHPDKGDTVCHAPFFIVYSNFWTILDYNSSYKYSLAVNMLADAIHKEMQPE